MFTPVNHVTYSLLLDLWVFMGYLLKSQCLVKSFFFFFTHSWHFHILNILALTFHSPIDDT